MTSCSRLRMARVLQQAGLPKMMCFSEYHGDPAWLRTIHGPQQAWAQRNQIELITVRKQEATEFSRSPIHEWLHFFLKSDAEWMMVLDVSVMIHPLAPHPLSCGLEEGLWVLEEPQQASLRRTWGRWLEQTLQRKSRPDYRFRNAAVWWMDRATAERLAPYAEQMLLPSVASDFYLNAWLERAEADGKIHLRSLPVAWNCLPAAKETPAWFYHCPGEEKGKWLERLQLAGLLPMRKPAMTIKPWPLQPELQQMIALPYHAANDPSGAECLRYALRSIQQYFPEHWPLRVYGTQQPEWLLESAFVHEPSYQASLLRAFSTADQVLWMNDDILFLKHTSLDEFRVPLALADVIPQLPALLSHENRWRRGRGHIAGRLLHEKGIDTLPNFSTHTPYLFQRDIARKVFDHFGVWHKFPLELAYHGLLGSDHRPCTEKATFETRDNPAMRWLNVDDAWLDLPEWQLWLQAKFPQPSRWESPT